MTENMAEGILVVPRAELPLVHGWILDGPGPARHGWAWRAASGRTYWLAATWSAVVRRAGEIMGMDHP